METDNSHQLQTKKDQNVGLVDALRFFSDDEKFVFVFKKTQKLVSALYLITGFFQDHEPLKWKLRALGSKLLSASIFLKDGTSSKRDKAILDIRSSVLEVTALFAVAKQSGMISDMNYEIINREFSLLLNSVSLSAESFGEGKTDLKEDFFKPVPGEKTAEDFRTQTVHSPETFAQKDETGIRDKSSNVGSKEAATGLLDAHVYETPSHLALIAKRQNEADSSYKSSMRPESKGFREFGAVAVKKNSRQSIIINLLKRKKEIMIKDVSPLIEGCSEKTIQRELLSMVHAGILHKEGEKRWSRYSLVKP